MVVSQTMEYALQAVLYIAARHPVPVRSGELSADLDLPPNYLGKTLSQLARAGVLFSARGTTGGFRLAREPRDIKLADVTRPFVGNEPRRCLLGLGDCGVHPECAMHKRWYPTAKMVDQFFDATTIADLVGHSDSSPAARVAADERPLPSTVRFPCL